MKCPYCLKDIVLFEEGNCPECKTQIDKVIVDNMKDTDFISVAFVGERGVGKTSYLTSLFFLFMYDDKYIRSHKLLNEEAFESILNNVRLLKNNILPEATDLSFSQIPLIKLTLKNNSNYVSSFVDAAGEIYNNKEQLKINPQAQKVFVSDIIFWIIDGERFFNDLLNNESDVLDDLALINRYLNVKHEFNENKQKLVIIFTKIDKVYNILYEHKEVFECFNKNNNDDWYQNIENIKICSNNIKKFLEQKGLSNFVNSIEDEFKSVLFSLTSSFPKGDNKEFKYDKNTPINVIEPFIYDFYKIEIQKEQKRKKELELKKQQELNRQKELELKKQQQLKIKKQIIISIMIVMFIIFLFIINSLFHPYEKYQEYKCQNGDIQICKEINNYKKACELGDKDICLEIENYEKACKLGDSRSCNIIKCENNDKEACYEIGNYNKGCELGDIESCKKTQNYKKACELGDIESCKKTQNYKKACELGDEQSCNIIKCKDNNKYACKKIGNYEKACELGDRKSCKKTQNYKKICELGDKKSCFKIGNYKKACELGDVRSCIKIENYQSACKLGDKKSCFKIGNYKKACELGDMRSCIKIENYEKACELGDEQSCNIIKCKDNNKYACKKIGNYKKACELGDIESCKKTQNYKKACELGDKKSCNIIKCKDNNKYACYKIGNYNRACELGYKRGCLKIGNNQKACAVGDMESCLKIGNNQKACELGDRESCYQVGNYKKACELGDKESCIIVGDEYKNGNYLALALEFYKKSCKLESYTGCSKYKKLKRKLKRIEIQK